MPIKHVDTPIVQGLKVLIVDDSPISVKILCESIRSLAQVFVATGGEMALSIIKDIMPDLILLDIEMPQTNGLEVCRQLKTSAEYSEIPIIFVTASQNPNVELTALDLGGIDYVTKPVNTHILRTRIKGHLLAVKRTKELVQAKNTLSSMINILPVFISYWTHEEQNIYSNDLQGKWFHISPKEMENKALLELFPVEHKAELKAHIDLVTKGENTALELSLVLPTQNKHDVHISFISEQLFDGKQGFLLVMTDITERKQTEQQLRSEKDIANITLESIGDSVIATDVDGIVSFINPIAEKMTGWTKQNAIGKTIEDVMILEDSFTHDLLPNPIRTALRERTIAGMPLDTVLVSADGKHYDVEDSASPILDKHGIMIGAIIVFHDVTESKRRTLEQAKIATQDPLTHLPNRYLLIDRAEQTIKQAKREKSCCAMLLLDIDEFSEINMHYGYLVGDKLLLAVSKMLVGMLRETDTLSRPGSDEFVVLLSCIDSMDIISDLSSRILQAINQEWEIDGNMLRLSVSIGIAMYPHDADDGGSLYRRADTAMRETKSYGKNDFRFFSSALEHAQQQQVSDTNALRDAIENNHISVYYQPKLDALSNKVVGAEALVRWIKTDGTVVFPDCFIPLAEKTKLIIPLGAMVLHQACKQLAKWHVTHPEMSVAVNVSAVQFNPALVNSVSSVIEAEKINANKVELEITESVLINDKHAIETLQKLKDTGVRLSMDDFGKGYSSLSYIKRFPIDVLKIDQSFVRSMLSSQTDLAICETIVALAQKLDLDLVAEGVETLEHVEQLLAMNCTIMQGYYYSKPITVDEFDSFLLEYSEG